MTALLHRARLRRGTTPLILAVLTLHCASNVPVPRGVAEGAGAAESAWARILSRHVDERGRIDFAAVPKDPADLYAFIAYVGAVSPGSDPSSFPTQAAVLAYYLNAYNGLAMYNVIVHFGARPNHSDEDWLCGRGIFEGPEIPRAWRDTY